MVADPEIRQGDTNVARYRLAVDRRFKRANDSQTADFIPCVAFGKSADFAEKYLYKGMKIAVTGRIQTGNYTKQDGTKVYTTDVIVEDQEFCESKGDAPQKTQPQTQPQNTQPAPQDGFMTLPDDFDGLPFD